METIQISTPKTRHFHHEYTPLLFSYISSEPNVHVSLQPKRNEGPKAKSPKKLPKSPFK